MFMCTCMWIFFPRSFICFFFFSPQNLQWARDVLLGSSVSWQQLKHMPAQGLFCERNKTNLFNVSHFTPRARPPGATRASDSIAALIISHRRTMWMCGDRKDAVGDETAA